MIFIAISENNADYSESYLSGDGLTYAQYWKYCVNKKNNSSSLSTLLEAQTCWFSMRLSLSTRFRTRLATKASTHFQFRTLFPTNFYVVLNYCILSQNLKQLLLHHGIVACTRLTKKKLLVRAQACLSSIYVSKNQF